MEPTPTWSYQTSPVEFGALRRRWRAELRFGSKGIGRRFARFVIGEAMRLGYQGMQFNAVVASNTRAIRVWESLGSAIVGMVPNAFRRAVDGLTAIHIMYAPREALLRVDADSW